VDTVHPGLYWEGADEPLIPAGLAQAGSKPYHGYYFRSLEGQGPNAPGGVHAYLVGGKLMGGFGLVAWPAEYGVTGIHTFIVNHKRHGLREGYRARRRQSAGACHAIRP
jgi:hypothetical protein